MRIQVVTYFLEMTAPADFRPAQGIPPDIVLSQAKIPCPELNRFFYTAVGGDWYWTNRLPWTYAQWRAYAERSELETWFVAISGTPAGYFELEAQPKAQVELVHFGLLPQFIGRGLGGYLLTVAIRRAWDMDAQRVWLHTCSLDHPRALAHYQKHGFRMYNEEVAEEELPEQTPGPWPGADIARKEKTDE